MATSAKPATEKNPARVAAAVKAAATRKANKAAAAAAAAADAGEETDPIVTEDESGDMPLDTGGNKGKEKQKDTIASRMKPVSTYICTVDPKIRECCVASNRAVLPKFRVHLEGLEHNHQIPQAREKLAASLRSTSPSGAGTPTGDNDEELSGTRPPQYLVVTHDPATQTDVFRPPAEFSIMISQANNSPSNPDPSNPTNQVEPSPSEPWELTQLGEPSRPPTSGVSQPTGFDPDARDEHIGSVEAATSGNIEAQDAYMSSLHRIQGSLLEAEAPRKEALERANSLEKHCIGVATIAFAAPGGVASLLELKDGKVVARINLRDPEVGHVEALKEQLANSHKKTDFKTPILIWAKDANVDPSIVDKMKKRDLYGVSEEVPILKIEMSPRENQIIHEIYWTMTQPHLAPDYDPVRDRNLKPRWLTRDELNDLAIELDTLREGRKFFILVNGQHRIVAMLSLAADLTKQRMEILSAAREKRISQAELETWIKAWSSKVRACTYRALVFESETPEALLVDWGTNTTEEPRRGEEQAELIWMTAQRYKAMIRNFLLENPGLHRRDVFTAARIEYIRQTGADSSMESKPGASTDTTKTSANAALPVQPSVDDDADNTGDEGQGEPGPKSKRQRRAMKKKSIAGAAAVKASSSHLSGVGNGAAVFQRIMSYSPFIELVLSTCGAYLFWNTSVRDAHGTTMLRPSGAILAMHLWLDVEILLNVASASETIVTPQIDDFVQRHRPTAKGYDDAVPVWESAFGRATSQPPGMSSWAKIQDRFSQEYAREFSVSKAQDDGWLEENMWLNKAITTHRHIYYRIGADPVLTKGSDQDRLFGAMLQLYALVPLGHKPLIADALGQGAPHSDTRPICPVPRFWPLGALPCRSRITAYNRRAGLSIVPSGESIHLLTFLLGRNFPMWLYHGGIEKHTRLLSRWYEVNPGFTQVLLAGFEATGVGSLEARLSLVIDLIEDKHLFESMIFIEHVMEKKELSFGRIMQECAVLNSHRHQSGAVKKGGNGHFDDALRYSQVDMTLAEAQKAWTSAIPQVRAYIEEGEGRVSDLLERNPVLEIISRRFWDHTQLRRWANGIPDGQSRALVTERALAWGICLDYYERVVISECLARLPQMQTLVEFVEKVYNLSQTAPWFNGLYDTATLSQLPPPSPAPSDNPSPPSERQPSAAPDSIEGPSLSLRPIAPVDYAEPEIEQPDDEPSSPLPGSPHAAEKPITAREASRNDPPKPVQPLTQISIELPTMSQVLQAQARTRAQGEAHAHAQVQVPAQRHQSLRPSPEQEHGSRASMPDLEQPKMEIDRQDAILSPASDPGAGGGRETHLRWAGHRNQRTFRWDLHPRQQQLNLPLPRPVLPVEKEDAEHLLLMEDMLIRMNAGAECIWAARANLRDELLNFGQYIAKSKFQLQLIINQCASEARNVCVRFMLSLIKDFSLATHISHDEATSEIAWMVKTDGLFDNMVFYIKYDQEHERLELWLNLKHTFPLLLQQHLDEEKHSVVVRGYAMSNLTLEGAVATLLDEHRPGLTSYTDIRLVHQLGGTAHALGAMGANEQERIYRSSVALQAYAITHGQQRGNSYVRHVGKSTAAPASFIADMGLQLSGINPGTDLLKGQDRCFEVCKIPRHILDRHLMQSKLSPWSVGVFVLGGVYRDPELEGWKRYDVVVRGPNDHMGELLRQRRIELATELAAVWEEQSQTHLTMYSNWLKQNNLSAKSTLSVLPNRAKYFQRQQRMLDEELSHREAQFELPRGRPLFMPGSSPDPESDTQDDPPLLDGPPSPGDAPLSDEPASPRQSPRPGDQPAEPLSTQDTAEPEQPNQGKQFRLSDLALSQRPGIFGKSLGLLPSTSTAPASRMTSGQSYRRMAPVEVPDESEEEGHDDDENDDQEMDLGTVSPLAGRSKLRRKRDRDSIATASSGGASAKAKKKARKVEGEDEEPSDVASS
ncbi:hypothetical protein RhiJN_02554 [Ceratobasidium sp. AG-Ba]|nr:hypothetical protein RhiJN_02554 [Ceratobasidium sp. AG-Ba]